MTKLNEMNLTFGDIVEVQVGKLPEAVRHILMQRTFSHIMGNEAAAVKARLMGGETPMDEADADKAVTTWQQEKLQAMIEGKFSLRVVGPRLTADEAIMRDFARNAIVAQAAAAKVATPKASDKESWDRGIDAYLARPEYRALAEAEVERRKASFKAPAADVGDVASLFAKTA